MDIQKEREAFLHEFEKTEQYRQQYGFYKIPLKYDEQKETWNFYDVQAAWEMWQAAKAQAVPKDSVVVSKWMLALALNSIENNEDNEGIIEDLQELIHKAQEPQITELKVEWASDCFKCGHHEAIICSTAAEASTKGWFHDGDEVKCTGCGNTGEMDARGEDSDICWNENEAND